MLGSRPVTAEFPANAWLIANTRWRTVSRIALATISLVNNKKRPAALQWLLQDPHEIKGGIT